MPDDVLDPDQVAAAMAGHTAVVGGLPDGGLAVTCAKLVEPGTRVMVLLVPGLLRLDLVAEAESLELRTRNLTERELRLEPVGEAWDGYRHPDRPEPLRLILAAEPAGGPVEGTVQVDRTTVERPPAVHLLLRAVFSRRS